MASFALGILSLGVVLSQGSPLAPFGTERKEKQIVGGLKEENLKNFALSSSPTANVAGFQNDVEQGAKPGESSQQSHSEGRFSIQPEPRNFYGRMLQAVSKFFSNPDDPADEDMGFLSKRKKSMVQPARHSQVQSVDLQDPDASSDLLATYQGVHYVDLPSTTETDPPASPPEEQEPLPAEEISPLASNPLDSTPSETKLARPALLNWGKSAWDSISSFISPAAGRADSVPLSSNEEMTNYLRQQPKSPAPPPLSPTSQDSAPNTNGSFPGGASEWETKARSVVNLLNHAADVFSPSGKAAVPALDMPVNPTDADSRSRASTPTASVQQLFSLPGAAKTVMNAVSLGADYSDYTSRNPTRSSQRLTSSGFTHPGKPHVSLETLRQTDGIGRTFVQGVDVGGAVVDVLTSTHELQQALRDLDIVGLALPGRSQQQATQVRGPNVGPLMSAANAIQRFANWSTAVDRAIDTGKDFSQTVSDTVRALRTKHQSEGSPIPDLQGKQPPEAGDNVPLTGQGVELLSAESPTPVTPGVKQEERGTAEGQGLTQGSAPHAEGQGLTPQGSSPKTADYANSENKNRPGSGVSATVAPEARTAFQSSPGHESAITRQLLQKPASSGRPLRILETGAEMMGDVAAAIDKTSTPPRSSAGSSGEYVVSLARDLYKLASFLFEVMDVTVSVADESMDAVQLHKLVDSYRSLAEDGSLAPLGVKPGKSPSKDLGLPTVSCVKKGMTCCIPAAAVLDWKTRPVFLQNEKRRECKANFVTRTSMLCATTPFENSKCGIIHTSTTDFNKYATVLPVAGFSSTALCECEMPRKRTAEGLSAVKGSASWTAAGKAVTRDLLQEAKEGWHLIKGISKTGNQVLDIVDHTLNPHRSAITGMADVMTKLLVNQQLQKIAETADPRSAVFPSISVELLPKVPLLRSLPPLPALPVFPGLSRTLSGDVPNDANK